MIMGKWADFGFGMLGEFGKGIVNSGFNALQGYQNYKYSEQAAENADKRFRQQYHDLFSPAAMLKQYKEAGLSPSLMFGGAPGSGGATAPQGTGALGPTINSGSLDMTQLATIKNIEKDTELKEAQKGLLGQQEMAQKLDNYLTEQTLTGNIYKTYLELNVMSAELQQTIAETEGIDWQNAFNKATENEQVNLLVNKNANLLKDLLVKNSQIKLNDKQAEHFNTIAEKWQMDVYQKWVELDIHQESVENQDNWFDEQVQYFYDQLEQDKELKSLDLKQRKWEMWTGVTTDVIKTAVYGTTLYATGGLSGLKKMPQIGFK